MKLSNTELLILEDLSVKYKGLEDLNFDIEDNSTTVLLDGDVIVHISINMVVIELVTQGLILTRSIGLLQLNLSDSGLLQETCGLCGSKSGQLLFSDRSTQAVIGNRSSIDLFADSWRVNPGEQILRETRKECGKPW